MTSSDLLDKTVIKKIKAINEMLVAFFIGKKRKLLIIRYLCLSVVVDKGKLKKSRVFLIVTFFLFICVFLLN